MTVNEIVLDLVKVSMFDTDIRIPDDADWAAVYDEMKKQTIAGLPFEFISNYSAGKVSANSEDAAKNRTECSVGDKVGSTAKSLKINDVELNNIGGAESVRKCGAS